MRSTRSFGIVGVSAKMSLLRACVRGRLSPSEARRYIELVHDRPRCHICKAEPDYKDTLGVYSLCASCWLADKATHEYLRACWLYYVCDEETGLPDDQFDSLCRELERHIELVRKTKWGSLFARPELPGHMLSPTDYPLEIQQRVPFYLWEKTQ